MFIFKIIEPQFNLENDVLQIFILNQFYASQFQFISHFQLQPNICMHIIQITYTHTFIFHILVYLTIT